MRPVTTFLEPELKAKIIDEAKETLCTLGVQVHHQEARSLLSDYGAKVEGTKGQVIFKPEMIDKALASVPSDFELFSTQGERTHHFKDRNFYFTPGSAALNVLDQKTGETRRPTTEDYIRYTKVTSALKHIDSQSTAFVPADVPETISDSYRLYLSLLYGEKPVITGTFSKESFHAMKDFQVAIRGSEESLREKPMTVFSICSTSPLKWSEMAVENLLDCARYGVPVEIIAMPLTGFIAPVTIVGTLIQHTAEIISGLTIQQLAFPGAPALFGGSPGIFDVRYETTPLGAVESMMIACSYNEIGKELKLPTQAYISLSDSKDLDAQAGVETSMGATLAALSGINQIAGPGMIDFQNCHSTEKLILDNEMCGSLRRLAEGVTPRDDFPAKPHFEELLEESHLLISKHTRKNLRKEHYLPSEIINRKNHERWKKDGSLTLKDRASQSIDKILENYEAPSLSKEVRAELQKRMETEAKERCDWTPPELNL